MVDGISQRFPVQGSHSFQDLGESTGFDHSERDESVPRNSLLFADVSKEFGSVIAVDSFTLEVKGGEFVTVLGPSGSGKTTMLNMVLGKVSPDAGEIFIDGRPVTGIPTHRRNIGMVFQNYALFPHMTVFDNVAFPLRMRHIPKAKIHARVQDMLRVVQLEGYESRLPRQLSGGQQQRIATARALVFRPSLVLMDEPLGALDRNLREHLQHEIKSIQRRLGVTILYVTHDQAEAMALADRVAIMGAGRLLQIDTPRLIYEYPASSLVAKFLGSVNIFKSRVERREADLWHVVTEGGMHVACSNARYRSDGDRRDVLVMVRSDRIELIENDQSPQSPIDTGHSIINREAGLITDVTFTGGVTTYSVKLQPSGHILQVRLPASGPVFPEGRSVIARWSSDAALILAE